MQDCEAAKAQVEVEELHFDSGWRGKRIRTWVWVPPAGVPVRGVLQIAHGMVEHAFRYDDFARFLAAHGFAVAANDHIGHGASAGNSEAIGKLPVDGGTIMIDDANALHLIMRERHPSVPYFVFGHSMGSFIMRAYIAAYGEELSGAVICGTGHQPAILTSLAAWLARCVAATRGWDYRSGFLHSMGIGGYSASVGHPRT